MSGWETLVGSGILRRDMPLAPHTTYKLGGPAALFATPSNEEQLSEVAAVWREDPVPVLILGRGSNLIVSDRGFPGLVVHLGEGFRRLQFEDQELHAGGAVALANLARRAVDQGRGGLEFYIGIPGSVGGAVRMNAGCHGSETADVLLTVSVLDLKAATISDRRASELDLGYRRSNVGDTEVVVSVGLAAPPGDPLRAAADLRDITRWRKDTQPGGTLNAGSVFKNTAEEAAGHLIDRVGLKGLAVGDVHVSEKHANFFVAGPNATADQVKELVDTVRAKVWEKVGVQLETEIRFVGWEES